MGEAIRYALWLAPGEEAESLTNLINQLSSQFHGPRFSPHVTLFDRVEGNEAELLDRAKQVANELGAFELKCGELVTTPYYFRSFYIMLENAPELLRARQMASEKLDLRMTPGYEPHLSLIYGNLGGKDYGKLKDQVADSIPPSVSLTRLQLIRLNVSVSDWEVAGEHPLAK